MPDLETEKEHLAKAERDIAAGESRITRQMLLIDKMRVDGHDVTEAEILLDTLQQTLKAWKEHRSEILREIARLEAPPSR